MNPDRRAAIIRLLQTRDQHLPEQHRRDHTPAGFIHQTIARESCPDCLTNGRKLRGCETCRGRGYIEHQRTRDPYATDRVLPYGLTADRHEQTRDRDALIDRLEQQTRPPWTSEADMLADANDHPYGWEQARRRMYARFDYRPLDLALDALRMVDQAAYHVLHSVYVYGWQTDPAPRLLRVAELGLAFVDGRMPDPIRAPGITIASEEVAA